MRIRTSIVIGLWLLVLIVGIFLISTLHTFSSLRVVFFNVGQGDAILISEGNTQVLIDGGRDGATLLAKLGRFMPFWDREIEGIIATHPDADHIGGLASVISRYRVDQFFDNGAESESGVYQHLTQVLSEASVTEHAVMGTGSRLIFPGGGVLSIVFPENGIARTLGETNEGSIVSRFVFGQSSFLFTGDLPHEESVLPNIEPTEVLKVAHHGSKYSTSAEWLALLQPKIAVVSVGKNRYGHPAEEVLKHLEQRGVIILRTDKGGDIVFVCREDGCRQETEER